ncbi:MAG: glycosyltransferase family 2 protein [Clostridia bacterium]|nr:glycosyltransferase family 2 protein [Clostridia bacterium]MBQ6961003.1 glycosyltransferase family 2 protein [Clostridia bacterium]
MEKISVIVPVYNAGLYLNRCVDSVLSQTMPPAEILLVDDGSTDQSGEICDLYARQWPNLLRVIHQENAGPSAARNNGINAAEGDYLCFLDSDDYLERDALERLVKAKGDADIVFGEMLVENPDGSVYCQTGADVSFRWNAEDALIEICSYRYLRISCCAALYSRKLFSDKRFPLNTMCEDYFLQYQLIADARWIAYTSKPVYHYYQRPQSRSRSQHISLAPMAASDAQLAFFRKNFPNIAWAAESDCVFARMGIYTAYIRNGAVCPPEQLESLRSVCRRFLKSVWRHDRLPLIKKIQAFVFCYFVPVYRFVIARTEHR